MVLCISHSTYSSAPLAWRASVFSQCVSVRCGERGTKWVFRLDTVSIVWHTSQQHKTQTQHNTNPVDSFLAVVSLEVSPWITCLADIHFHYGVTFRGGMCVFASAACLTVPECHTIMRMDMTVTGPSANGAAGLPPFLFVTRSCGCPATDTHTHTHKYAPRIRTILFYLRQWGAIEARQ